ncbi:uncharacterized protein LOC126600469 [Malus sylvestris]|uniref:uncharacterized protein LOC126600469 n=1 Tax=Malus sylvestris TaxID=3752 RepID=UPI0021AC86B0|nr:uncharacterized protein LOC126600469 [Malus sylvestris]
MAIDTMTTMINLIHKNWLTLWKFWKTLSLPIFRVVLALYDVLSSRDVDTVLQIVALDLEWWFHGPPTHQFLMRLLTDSPNESFQLIPQSITSFGPPVLVESCDRDCSISWVHTWTVVHSILEFHLISRRFRESSEMGAHRFDEEEEEDRGLGC